jgi:small ligand-binding sensory domain FIST
MPVRMATGLVPHDGGLDAFAEAAARAQLGLGGAPADLVAVFAATDDLTSVEDGLAAVEARLSARALMGCGAGGVLGAGREHERGGVVVWAASLGGGVADSFHLEPLAAGDDGIVIAGLPDLDGADAVILLADPYSFPIEPLLAQLGVDFPGLPVIGGLASARHAEDGAVLMCDDAVHNSGAVGAVLRGVDVRACVSQGARPIGPEMVVTAADGNVVHELASRPALQRLREAIGELAHDERLLAAHGLLLGIVIDENRPEYERGDFLVRGLVDVNEESGSVTVGDRVRVGQTARLHVRDGASADEDLREALDRQSRELGHAPPAGALVFTCNGRGVGMFGTPDHDASAVEDAFGRVPTAGFFCAGEIGPVGARNFLHGFTATMAVFPAG